MLNFKTSPILLIFLALISNSVFIHSFQLRSTRASESRPFLCAMLHGKCGCPELCRQRRLVKFNQCHHSAPDEGYDPQSPSVWTATAGCNAPETIFFMARAPSQLPPQKRKVFFFLEMVNAKSTYLVSLLLLHGPFSLFFHPPQNS